MAAEADLKAAGIDEVLVYCVNDGAVMAGWAEDQGISGSIVSFLADTRAELTKALGVELTHEGPMHALGNLRCKRFAAIVDEWLSKGGAWGVSVVLRSLGTRWGCSTREGVR